MKRNVVRKHNDVIEACYDMSVPELRLIYSCISKIGFEQTISKEEPFFISSSEYAEVFNVDQKNVHREIRKAVNLIWDRELIIKRENQKDLRCRWVSAEAEYEKGGAEIHFASQVIPYLTNLAEHGSFTRYQLENIGGLKSTYAIRLYELLVQYKKIGVREIKISEIREILCLGNKYKTMCNFKDRVITPSIKEINEHTDIEVSYTQKMFRRRVDTFTFTITSKTNKFPKELGKKYLSKTEVEAMAKAGDSWGVTYSKLAKKGYTFDKVTNSFPQNY